MQNTNNIHYCELDFGTVFVEKKVRDRAIADRIEVIKSSHS